MPIPRKPVKDVEEFIKTAKAEGTEKSKSDTGAERPQIKKFLLELPYELWMELKMRAVREGWRCRAPPAPDSADFHFSIGTRTPCSPSNSSARSISGGRSKPTRPNRRRNSCSMTART